MELYVTHSKKSWWPDIFLVSITIGISYKCRVCTCTILAKESWALPMKAMNIPVLAELWLVSHLNANYACFGIYLLSLTGSLNLCTSRI